LTYNGYLNLFEQLINGAVLITISLLLIWSRNSLLLWKLKILYHIVTSYFSRINLILSSNIHVGNLTRLFHADSQNISRFHLSTYCAGKKV